MQRLRRYLPLFIIINISVLLAISALLFKESTSSQVMSPHVILISVDTLRADHMSTYGYKKKTTPHIDAWAEKATVFTNMYTSVPMTYPSFVSLMTGKSPFESGIFNNGTLVDTVTIEKDGVPVVLEKRGNPPLNNDTVTLAELLKSRHYDTAGFITSFILDPKHSQLNRGFDTYHTYPDAQGQTAENPQMLTDVTEWLTQHSDSSKPFFLWVHLFNPHTPYIPPKAYQCDNNDPSCPVSSEKSAERLEIERLQLEGCHQDALSTQVIEAYKALYDGEIAYSDTMVGEILSIVEELGLDKDAIVVFYGDHGEGFENNYYFDHGEALYESSVRIPLIMKLPDQKKGGNHEQLLENKQFFPTLLDLLEIPLPEGIDSTGSFASLIKGAAKTETYNQPVYYVNAALSKIAIREGDFKLITSFREAECRSKDELFFLKDDPVESSNVVNKYPEKADELREKLLEYVLNQRLYYIYGQNSQPMQSQADDQERIDRLRSLGY